LITAPVYELPFDDASFDVVYANAVLRYLREPVRALVEMRRVLRPGGLAPASDDDLGHRGDLAGPSRAATRAAPVRVRRAPGNRPSPTDRPKSVAAYLTTTRRS
jgi:ubiquinone/menaquinone biosynthesis C-methylase UbiE